MGSQRSTIHQESHAPHAPMVFGLDRRARIFVVSNSRTFLFMISLSHVSAGKQMALEEWHPSCIPEGYSPLRILQ
jgi:hypothetical protein